MTNIYTAGTFQAKPSSVQRDWWIIDASQYTLGRLASRVALILRGKHKSYYTPHIDCGDSIVIINAKQIKVTGKKLEQNRFYWHTGYAGGIKEKVWNKILSSKFPERLLMKAIERMMPKDSPLAHKQLKSLHIYAEAEHLHDGQQPKVLDLSNQRMKIK